MMTSIRNACIYINEAALNTCLCKRQEKFILNYPLIDANMGVPIKACCDFNWNESCIIDAKCLDDLPKWIEQILPESLTSSNLGKSNDYVGYLKVIEMIISSLSTESHLSAWKVVEGENYDLPIAVGYTEIQGTFGLDPKKVKNLEKKLKSSQLSNVSSDEITFDVAMHKFHDAQKLIFFSKLQLSLIDISIHIHMILWSDYGTGK